MVVETITNPHFLLGLGITLASSLFTLVALAVAREICKNDTNHHKNKKSPSDDDTDEIIDYVPPPKRGRPRKNPVVSWHA